MTCSNSCCINKTCFEPVLSTRIMCHILYECRNIKICILLTYLNKWVNWVDVKKFTSLAGFTRRAKPELNSFKDIHGTAYHNLCIVCGGNTLLRSTFFSISACFTSMAHFMQGTKKPNWKNTLLLHFLFPISHALQVGHTCQTYFPPFCHVLLVLRKTAVKSHNSILLAQFPWNIHCSKYYRRSWQRLSPRHLYGLLIPPREIVFYETLCPGVLTMQNSGGIVDRVSCSEFAIGECVCVCVWGGGGGGGSCNLGLCQ